MSISVAPAETDFLICVILSSREILPAGNPVETAAMGIEVPFNASLANGIKL